MSTHSPRTLPRPIVAILACLTLGLGVLVAVGTAPAEAAGTASISGKVTPFPATDDQDAPEDQGARLTLWQFQDDYWEEVYGGEGPRTARTSATGAYSFTALEPGTYQVRLEGFTLYGETDDDGNATPDVEYAPMFWRNSPTVESGTAITLKKAEQRANVDFAAVEAGHVSGNLSPASGVSADNLSVVALHQDPESKKWSRAGSSFDSDFEDGGEGFGLTLLPGTYKLKFRDDTGRHYSEFWKDSPTVDAADEVLVAAGETTTGYDATLEKAGRIEGRITDTTGAPLPDAYAQVETYDTATQEWIDVRDRDEDVASGSTQSDDETGEPTGRYGVGPLPAGTYRVRFSAGDHLTQYYGGTSEDDAELITLERGQSVQGVDGTLAKPGSVRGKILLPNGKGYGRAFVDLFQKNDAGAWESVTGTGTSSNGSFVIDEVPPGRYALKILPDDDAYAPQVYLGQTSLDKGAQITVTSGATKALSTVKLVAGGTISGAVTLPSGVSDQRARTVDVVDPASNEVLSSALASKVGSSKTYSYSVKGLAAGSYRVQFARASGQSLAVGQYYKGVTEALGKEKATNVKVSPGKTMSGINGSPTKGGTIRGRVLSADGQPVRCYVMASTADDKLATRTAFSSAATGDFTVTGLSNGEYTLRIVGGYPGGEACNLPGTVGNSSSADYYFDGDDSEGHTTGDPEQANTVTITAGTAQTLPDLYYGPVDADTFDDAPTPVVTGTAAVGKVLTSTPADPKQASPEAEGVDVQWYRGTQPIDGATENTYTVTAEDAGSPITVRHIFRSDRYVPLARGSEPKNVGAFSLKKPTISGTASVGKKLTAARGTWAGSGWTYTYQWYRGSAAISKATKSTYTTVKADSKKSISVRVTAKKTGYASATAASAAKKIG